MAAAQRLIDSVVSDPERLLGQWFDRSLLPKDVSLCNTLTILIETVLQGSVQLKIKLTDYTDTVKGSLHIFENENFAINITILTAEELRCLAIIVGSEPSNHFSEIHKSASTNTHIFGDSKQQLHIKREHRLKLVQQACYQMLYFCQNLCNSNTLQIKDRILKILMHYVDNHCDKDIWRLYKTLQCGILGKLDTLICTSPTTVSIKIHDCVKHGSPTLRRTINKTTEPRNFFLGDDWFSKTYGM